MSNKHKKKQHKKSYNRNEPFDSALNLAGGLAMAAIAAKMEDKHHYSERGKVNPYAASAFGIASGKMRTTEDVIRRGDFLGAMGAFDDDVTGYKSGDVDVFKTDPIPFRREAANTWRDYCESGDEYGLDPEDFDSADDYEDALNEAQMTAEKCREEDDGEDSVIYMTPGEGNNTSDDKKYCWRKYCVDGRAYGVYPEDYETADDYADALEVAMKDR